MHSLPGGSHVENTSGQKMAPWKKYIGSNERLSNSELYMRLEPFAIAGLQLHVKEERREEGLRCASSLGSQYLAGTGHRTVQTTHGTDSDSNTQHA